MNRYRQVGIGVLALAAVPLLFGRLGFAMRLATEMAIFALLAVALNVSFGHTDQLFLFMGGLAGVGAYATALLAESTGVSPWLTLPVAVALCAVIAGLVSYVAARREFTVILIAILTLNLQLALLSFFRGAREITRGTTGFGYDGLVPAAVGETVEESLGLVPEVGLYYLLVVLVGVALLIYVRLVESRLGLAFDAIREDETAAASAGIDVVRYKTVAGMLSGAMIGVAGVMFVELEDKFILPELFTFLGVDVVVLIVLVLGGLRTTLGPVVGAAIVITLEEVLVQITEFQTTVFGALLIALFLYFRSGVVPAVGDTLDRSGLLGRGGTGRPDED
ncbi:MAG: branched-chain amino acid ABC transporter permease [Salinirussus sp.]